MINENILITFVVGIFLKHLYWYMSRPRTLRKVVAPPKFKGFKPYGVGGSSEDYLELFYEEFEALKLADYELMNHAEAASVMGISRSTFARIYEKARRKIASALVEVKEIRAVYGHAVLDKNWYECEECHAKFTIPKSIVNHSCAICASGRIGLINK